MLFSKLSILSLEARRKTGLCPRTTISELVVARIRDGVLAPDHYISKTDTPATSVNISLDTIGWIFDGAPHNIWWHIG